MLNYLGSICGAALKIVGRPVILTDINYLKLQTALGDSRILRQLMHKLWVKRSNFCQIIFDIAQRTENFLPKSFPGIFAWGWSVLQKLFCFELKMTHFTLFPGLGGREYFVYSSSPQIASLVSTCHYVWVWAKSLRRWWEGGSWDQL